MSKWSWITIDIKDCIYNTTKGEIKIPCEVLEKYFNKHKAASVSKPCPSAPQAGMLEPQSGIKEL